MNGALFSALLSKYDCHWDMHALSVQQTLNFSLFNLICFDNHSEQFRKRNLSGMGVSLKWNLSRGHNGMLPFAALIPMQYIEIDTNAMSLLSTHTRIYDRSDSRRVDGLAPLVPATRLNTVNYSMHFDQILAATKSHKRHISETMLFFKTAWANDVGEYYELNTHSVRHTHHRRTHEIAFNIFFCVSNVNFKYIFLISFWIPQSMNVSSSLRTARGACFSLIIRGNDSFAFPSRVRLRTHFIKLRRKSSSKSEREREKWKSKISKSHWKSKNKRHRNGSRSWCLWVLALASCWIARQLEFLTSKIAAQSKMKKSADSKFLDENRMCAVRLSPERWRRNDDFAWNFE